LLPAPSTIVYSNGLSGGCLLTGNSNLSTLSVVTGSCGTSVTETWTATDICARVISAVSRTIVINDNLFPSATAPTSIDIECGNAAPSGATTYAAFTGLGGTASDNCTANANLVIAYTDAALVGTNCSGTIARTYTVTDACGNTTTVTQTITVTDNTVPTVLSTDSANDPDIDNYACGSTYNYNTNPSQCAVNVTITTPTWTDNCDPTVTRTRSTSNGTALSSFGDFVSGNFPSGTTIVSFMGTDDCSNTSTCSLTIIVTDNQAPTVASCTPNQVKVTDPGMCSAAVTMPAPVFNDNCAVTSVMYSATGASTFNSIGILSSGTFNAGVTTITYTVADAQGNTSTSCSFTVTVNDNQVPVISTCPPAISVAANNAGCTAVGVSLGTPVVTDNCASFTVSNDAPVTFPLGNTTVVWTVTDQAGSVTCSQIVTVTPSGTASITITETSGLTPNDGTICAGDAVMLTANAGSSYMWDFGSIIQTVTINAAGTYTVTVSNGIGCTASASVTITVIPAIMNNNIALGFTNPVCDDAVTALINQSGPSVSGGTGTYTYQWEYNDGTGWMNAIGASSTALQYDVMEGGYAVGVFQFRRKVFSGGCPSESNPVSVTISACGVLLNPKAMLQGPYNAVTMLMNDNLRAANLIPLTEPYTGMSGFTHVGGGGGEVTTSAVLAVTGNNAIVDWVFLQLRDATNPATVLFTRSALIQRDGDIVDVDGVSPVKFNSAPVGNYHVAVRHRNHLPIRSANVLALSDITTTPIDFITNLTVAYDNPMIVNDALITNGSIFLMWACNANSNLAINIADITIVSSASSPAQFNVYNRSDVNMNGSVNAADLTRTTNQGTLAKSAHIEN
jgi:HYR domain